MSKTCGFVGIHDEEREAVLEAGWMCTDGHVHAIAYCEECWDWLDEARVEKRVILCDPTAIFEAGGCRAETMVLEAVRV